MSKIDAATTRNVMAEMHKRDDFQRVCAAFPAMGHWAMTIASVTQGIIEQAKAKPPAPEVVIVEADRLGYLRGYTDGINGVVTGNPEKDVALPTPGLADRLAWQPIETAPRDATYVLCAHASGHINIMQYCLAGYWRGYVRDSKNWRPTHWMPLPAEPAAEHEKGGK